MLSTICFIHFVLFLYLLYSTCATCIFIIIFFHSFWKYLEISVVDHIQFWIFNKYFFYHYLLLKLIKFLQGTVLPIKKLLWVINSFIQYFCIIVEIFYLMFYLRKVPKLFFFNSRNKNNTSV